jgi:hypothetical protein
MLPGQFVTCNMWARCFFIAMRSNVIDVPKYKNAGKYDKQGNVWRASVQMMHQ